MMGMRILVVTAREDQLRSLCRMLEEEPGCQVDVAVTAADAMEALSRMAPQLVIVDQQVGPVSSLDLVRQLLGVNAFVHTAVLSDMDEVTFHERAEGLGVLCRLPTTPGRQDAGTVLELLKQVMQDQSY